jgi:hypothetical protein
LDLGNPVATFEGGKLYKAGSLNVIELHGSYREMGRQYGALMKKELNEIYNQMNGDFGKIEGITYDSMLKKGRMLFEYYPQKYKEIVFGISETSGLGLDKQLIVNAKEYYIPVAPLAHQCSGVAAWGNYTSGRPLVFGRNYDFGPALAEYVTVAVYNPEDGSLPTASITYAGSIYVTSGLNKKGLFLELNNGGVSETAQYTNRVPALVSLFAFLESAADLKQLNAEFHSTLPDYAYVINVADPEKAYSYEWATFDVRRRSPDEDGLLVATNHFVDPSWGLAEPEMGAFDPANTSERRTNLLALAEKYKGNFSSQTMMEVMSLPLEKGGSFRAPHDTSYQIVAVPQDLKVWVRIPEVSDWTEVDLKPLFH